MIYIYIRICRCICMYMYMYLYIYICVCIDIHVCMYVCMYVYKYMYMGHGQYLICSLYSSIFWECIIVFQVLEIRMRISYIFHCILMVFQQRVKYFLTLSNVAQSCKTLGHAFFFMELTPPLAQPPLSYHYRQQPLSPTTVATTASTPSHEILIFTSSTLNS